MGIIIVLAAWGCWEELLHIKQVGPLWMHFHAFCYYYSTNPYFHSEADQMDILNIDCKNDREVRLIFKNGMKRINILFMNMQYLSSTCYTAIKSFH